MLKKFLHIILLLICICFVGQANACDKTKESKNDASDLPFPAFVQIINVKFIIPADCPKNKACRPDIEKFEGSGVLVSKSTNTTSVAYALTARHVCVQTKNKNIIQFLRVKDYYGKIHEATIVHKATNFDGCVIKINDIGKDLKIADVADAQPEIGSRVLSFGAPRGNFSPKMVPTFEGFYSGEDIDSCVYTVPAAPGSSGSPIFDSKARLISIIWSVMSSRQIDPTSENIQIFENLSYGLKLDQIKSLLNAISAIESVELFETMTSTAVD